MRDISRFCGDLLNLFGAEKCVSDDIDMRCLKQKVVSHIIDVLFMWLCSEIYLIHLKGHLQISIFNFKNTNVLFFGVVITIYVFAKETFDTV